LHPLDPPPRGGAEDLAPDVDGRARPHRRAVRAAYRARDRLHHAHERLYALRLVGAQQLGARVPEPAPVARRHRPRVVDDVAVRDRDGGGDVVRLHQLRLYRRRDRPQADVRDLRPRRGPHPADLRIAEGAVDPARPRTARRVFRYRLLQRIRRAHRRALSDVRARPGRGRLLQHRPHRQRRRSVRGRQAGGDARVRRRICRRRHRVLPRGACVDRHSRDPQPGAGMRTMIPILLAAAAALSQTQSVQDEYAVYDLLAPASGTFKTVYEVAVTTPGATEFRDGIGSGLTPVAASDDGVTDLMTGAALKFDVDGRALRIHLAR